MKFANNNWEMEREKTIKDKLVFEGVGIHTGERSKIVLHPEEEGRGITFIKDGEKIPALYKYVVNTNHSTDLGKNGKVVKTVEHLMASLHLLGITNLSVEVFGEEIPILDGSGYGFYEELSKNLAEQSSYVEYFNINAKAFVSNNGSYIVAKPCSCLEITYEGEFRNFLGKQKYTFRGEKPEEIILARTFCFEWEIETLRSLGLGKGGSLENTLVLGKDCIYNPGGMRYEEEPVRHKVLDLVGDLYLLGKPVKGKFYSYKGGHTLNYKLVLHLALGSSQSCKIKEEALTKS